MEGQEFGERMRHPEFDKKNPGALFEYAQDMQRWLRRRFTPEVLASELDVLVARLEAYAVKAFEAPPEVTVQSKEVWHTRALYKGLDEYRIRAEPLPLTQDAEMYGEQEHLIEGVFRGFYRSDDQTLRAYIATPELHSPVKTPGGVFQPYLSVDVENTTITLTENTISEQFGKQLEALRLYLSFCDQQTVDLVDELVRVLVEAEGSTAKQLQASAQEVIDLGGHNDESSLMPILLDIITTKLSLSSPQNISARQHRVVFTEYPKPAYKLIESPATFSNVSVHLDFIGETDTRMLALCFLDSEGKSIQIPTQYIAHIEKTKPKLL